MSHVTPLRIPSWLAAAGMLAVLLAIVLNGFGVARLSPGSGSLMRWHDASHDWLLVVDDAGNQLVVYDADNGRLLRRLDAASVGDVAALARRDGRLYVIDDNGTRRELALPQLPRLVSGTP